MKSKKLGLYVHIPFCVKKCNYCDFCSFADIESQKRTRYIERLCEEIASYKGRAEGYYIESIFFGGGTPSLLTSEEFEKITHALKNTFSFCRDIEFTLESNPKTITREKLSHYVSLGVNRLSIGVQSIHEKELHALGRIHTYEDARSSISIARECGIENINVDLMYAIPEQTRENFIATVDTVTALPITHISAYSLIVEENTPFGKNRDKLILPSEEDELFMVDYLHKKLQENGYTHYEISNYARAGKESRHNLLYWKMEEYIGLGLNAHSDFCGVRFSNTQSLDEYLSENYVEYRVSASPDIEERAFEYAMLRLRLKDGLSLSEYEKRFGRPFLQNKEEYVKRCIKGGYLLLEGDILAFTEEGFYVSNEILREIL